VKLGVTESDGVTDGDAENVGVCDMLGDSMMTVTSVDASDEFTTSDAVYVPGFVCGGTTNVEEWFRLAPAGRSVYKSW
jgi:hypothetical protein